MANVANKNGHQLKIQVLVSTMHLKSPGSFIKEANLHTSSVIINQCDDFSIRKIGDVIVYDMPDRGVGRSRNNALLRANADIVLIADDDETYVNDYESLVKEEFLSHPKADMIIFNVESKNPNRPTYSINHFHRLNQFNGVKFGAYRIALKLESQRKKNVFFSLQFGGGAKYSCGEDSLFIRDCIKSKMKVYASPRIIGSVKQTSSTWFKDYDHKYFYDKGVLYRYIDPRLKTLRCLMFIIKNHKKMCSKIKPLKALAIMLRGARNG